MSTPEHDPSQEQQESWKDVLAQFAILGQSIGRAIEASWQHPRTQEVIEPVKKGLRLAVDEIDATIAHVKEEQAVQDFFEEARETFEVLEGQGKEALGNARPHVEEALKNLNAAISNVINNLNAAREESPADDGDPSI